MTKVTNVTGKFEIRYFQAIGAGRAEGSSTRYVSDTGDLWELLQRDPGRRWLPTVLEHLKYNSVHRMQQVSAKTELTRGYKTVVQEIYNFLSTKST